MPSPFPGMDPYIETPEVWRDFHNNLASEIQGRLNRDLAPRYFAALEAYVTYETVEVSAARRAYPDVSVWRETSKEGDRPTSAATIVRAPSESLVPLEEELQLFTVEVRRTADRLLVTSIEFLSPVNKQSGHEAAGAYLRKRRALLNSQAHLLEIDLLRGGERPPLLQPVPRAPYYVTLSRAQRRPVVEVWPVSLRDALPVVPVPLLPPDPDVPLDLRAAVAAVYDRGAYDRRLNYGEPAPPPPLPAEDDVWVGELLKALRK